LLTGGKGLHVVAPLAPRADWPAVRDFAETLARSLARAAPDRYVAKASKSAREGRIFIDWLRNGAMATAIAPFSPRARPGAPVALPVRWDELGRLDRASAYDIPAAARRLSRLKRDPWADWAEAARPLPEGAAQRMRRLL
jgi:bifunctional non-homologous end joining protein LigD